MAENTKSPGRIIHAMKAMCNSYWQDTNREATFRCMSTRDTSRSRWRSTSEKAWVRQLEILRIHLSHVSSWQRRQRSSATWRECVVYQNWDCTTVVAVVNQWLTPVFWNVDIAWLWRLRSTDVLWKIQIPNEFSFLTTIFHLWFGRIVSNLESLDVYSASCFARDLVDLTKVYNWSDEKTKRDGNKRTGL